MKNKLFTICLSVFTVGLISCKEKDAKNSQKENEVEQTTQEKEDITSQEEKAFAEQTNNDELADKVKKYITSEFLNEPDLKAISASDKKFQLYQIDLNNDGKKEVFVNFMTPYFCGSGGCTLLLLNDQIELINEFTVTRTPIFAEKTMENGWKVLLTRSEGDLKKLIYANGTYPTNPSLVEKIAETPGEDAEIIFDEDKKSKTYNF